MFLPSSMPWSNGFSQIKETTIIFSIKKVEDSQVKPNLCGNMNTKNIFPGQRAR